MNFSNRIRPAVGAAACVAALVCLMGGPSAHAAESGNLLANPGLIRTPSTATLPDGFWQSTPSFDCAPPHVPLAIAYTYGTEGGTPYMDVDISNAAANCTANYVLVLPVTGSDANVNVGAKYSMTADVRVLTTTGGALLYDGVSTGGVSLQFVNAGNYVGEQMARYQGDLASGQAIKVEYYSGEPAQGGLVPQSVMPVIGAYSIKPGHRLMVRFKNLSLIRTDAATAITVNGLIGKTLFARNGTPLKVSVPVTPVAYTGTPVTSTLSFIDANGVSQGTLVNLPNHSATYLTGQSWAPTYDSWQGALTGLSPGRYTIRYFVDLPGSNVQAGPNATAVTLSSGKKAFNVGTLIVTSKAGMYIGQHFHRYPGPSGTALPTGYNHDFARSHNHDGVVDPVNGLTYLNWWTADNSYTWNLFDNWANFHAGLATAPSKKLLINFMGSPPWLTGDEDHVSGYGQDGLLAAPKDFDAYAHMVTAVVNKYKDRIFAVECWNEPDGGFFAPTKLGPKASLPTVTQLAELCKVIHTATKAVDPNIPTICPQVANPDRMKTWLSATTAGGQPVTDYCDLVGAHAYNKLGSSAAGQPYGPKADSLMETVRQMRATLTEMGVDKPIAITEAGFYDRTTHDWTDGTVFSEKTLAKRGEISYQTLATARELGVVLYGLYSFDGGASDGASQGLEGNAFDSISQDLSTNTVNQKNSAAATDLGPTGQGLQPLALDLFMLPTKSAVSMAAGTALNFNLTVANTGLVAAEMTAVSILPSITNYQYPGGNPGIAGSSIYTISSLVGPSGSTCTPSSTTLTNAQGSQSVTQWTCQGIKVPAGGVVTLTANGQVTPSSAQNVYIWGGYTYNFTVSATTSWSNRPTTVSIPSVTSPLIVVGQ